MNQQLYQKVIAILATVKNIAPEAIGADASFEQLGMDSLDKINFLFELESEFNLDIPDEEARAIASVGQIVDRLEKQLSQKKQAGA